MKLLVCFFCGIGILGVVCLSKKMQWRPNQQRIFGALFLFSPIIIQHLAIGYYPWLNLYLFPWLLVFLLDEKPLRVVVGVAAILSLTLLQGGLHPFVWYVIFTIIFFLIHFLRKPAVKTIFLCIFVIGITLLLSLARVATSLQIFTDFQQRFFNGYSLNGFIRWGLTPPVFTPIDMDDIEPYIESYDNGVPYWDGAIYWGGVLPLAFVGLFILVKRFPLKIKTRKETSELLVISAGLAACCMTLLSFGDLYQNLIVPLSNWVGISALQGMEKYPFRFAIIGYFSFSFIIAHYFDEIIAVLQQLASTMHLLLNQINKRLLMVIKGNWRHWLLLIAVFSTIILGVALLTRNAFFSWLEPAIKSAYLGERYPWLTDLMSQRSMIPLAAYLQKGNNLYAGFQRYLITGSLVGWGLYFIIRFNRKLVALLNAVLRTIKKQIPILIEIALVLPLLFAFIMWQRVALATPINYKHQYSLVPPEIETIPNSSISSIVVSVTPSQLLIDKEINIDINRFIFTNLKYSDYRFLKTDDVNDKWFNANGALGLITSDSTRAAIQVKPEIYLPTLWVTLVSWVGLMTIAFVDCMKRKSESDNI